MDNNLTKLYEFMKKRMSALEHEILMDKGGGLADSQAKYMEVKFWKEYIERECKDDKTS